MSGSAQPRSVPRRSIGSAPIRVMIVDDSIVARTVLAGMLADHDDFTIAAQVGTALAALERLAHVTVDVILLDLQMPGMNGLFALPQLIAKSGGAKVLVVSSAAAEGAEASISALRLGAADTLLKPRAGDFAGAFASELATRLRRIARAPESTIPPVATARRAIARRDQPLDCIAIGASTGGVPALADFLAALPTTVRAPILVTQHLPAPFMPYFAGQLAEMARRPARVAEDGMKLVPGQVLLAPGHAHLAIVRTRDIVHVKLDSAPSPSGCKPSVDPMFKSVAAQFGARAAGVVLSGMGRDGALGAATLAQAGAMVLAQDAATSVIWGMPGAVVGQGIAQAVLPPAGLAATLAEWSDAWK